MKRQSLDAAQTMMERKLELAAQALAQAQKALLDQQDQLQLLIQYKADYQQALQQSGRVGTSAKNLMELNTFVERLEQNIVQQKQRLSQFEKQCELKRKEWQLSYQKSKAVGHLQQRLAQQHRREQQKLEQKQMDEHAAVRHRKNHTEKN